MTGASLREPLDWHSIRWRHVHRNVRRLHVRIVKAWKAGSQRKVRALPCMLTRSLSGRAVAVTRVTDHQGKRTPGVDQVIWDTPRKKGQAAGALPHRHDHPQPLRRVYIPNSDGRQRGLSIPTQQERAMQALHWLALDPIAETTADALAQCYCDVAKTTSAQWVLEGDMKACVDELSHAWMLTHTPMDHVTLTKCLKAGDVDQHGWQPTEAGAPQGGIRSPMLATIVLHEGLDAGDERDVTPRMNGRTCLVPFADACGSGCEREADARKEADMGTGTGECLGCPHAWARSRRGSWVIKRNTSGTRLRRAQQSLWQWCRSSRHTSLPEPYRQVCQQRRGHSQDSGIRGHDRRLDTLCTYAAQAWRYWLSRRRHMSALPWETFDRLHVRFPLPAPSIVHAL